MYHLSINSHVITVINICPYPGRQLHWKYSSQPVNLLHTIKFSRFKDISLIQDEIYDDDY